MSNRPIIHQPTSTNSIFTLMPDEYIRFEYSYKPGCCWFSSKTTIVTNMRLITRVSKTPNIYINSIKQLKSAIPSSQNTWWMKLFRILTCTCSNPEIDWLESCRGIDNLTMDTTNETTDRTQKSVVMERF